MMYDTYPCKIKEINLKPGQESYEIPGYDGARVSKLSPPGKLLSFKYDDTRTLIDMMERGCKLSDNGRCLGWRTPDSQYTWITYREFLNRARNFASGLENIGINLGQSQRIGIYAINSVQWLITQYGCFYYSSPVVPLYDTIGPDARTYMINNAETSVIICDESKRIKALLESSEATPKLKYIIHINDISDELKELGEKKKIALHLFKDIEEQGKSSPVPIRPAKQEDVALICHTSGTTGNPKGAILTHANAIIAICGLIDKMGEHLPNKDDIAISYLPLAHIYEQLFQVFMFINGSGIGFYSGDVSLLTEDMKILKPTIFASVPRVLGKIYDKVQSQIKMMKANTIKKDIKDKVPTNDVKKKDELLYDPIVCKLISDSLGGRIRLIISGAAPISDNILSFFLTIFKCGIMEVYGQTESTGPCLINLVTPETVGCGVGSPLLCNMIKLVDVPELGYFTKNNIGEICVKGGNVFKGYLNDPEKTAEALDEDGWLHSGDVGTWLPNGNLKIVDRKKHIFKLSQGEYIMPEKIENVYSMSPYISQIFVHGDSLQDFLLAIVIPERAEILPWCKENSIDGTWTEICKNKMVKKHILDNMKEVGKAGGLLSFQQVKDIHVHPEVLTIEGGHLTPTQKTKRDVVQKLFLKEIHELYNKH